MLSAKSLLSDVQNLGIIFTYTNRKEVWERRPNLSSICNWTGDFMRQKWRIYGLSDKKTLSYVADIFFTMLLLDSQGKI